MALAALAAARQQLVAPDQHRVDDDDQLALEREAHEVAAPLDRLEPPAREQRRERLGHHDPQDGGIAGARRRDALARERGAQAVFDVDEVGKLGHGRLLRTVWHSGPAAVQTRCMPLPMLIIVLLVSAGCVVFLVGQVRTLRRRKSATSCTGKRASPSRASGDWD